MTIQEKVCLLERRVEVLAVALQGLMEHFHGVNLAGFEMKEGAQFDWTAFDDTPAVPSDAGEE